MIARYSRPAMREIWSEQRKLEIWLQIELLASEALCAQGLVPEKDLALMKTKAAFNLERCQELEKTLNHDVIAFTTNVAENIGAPCRGGGQTFGRRRDQRAPFAQSGGVRLPETWLAAGAGGHAGGATGSARRVYRHARAGGRERRALGHGVSPPPAHRSFGSGRIFCSRPERLQRHAPQAQSHYRRAARGPGARHPGPRRGRAGKRGALA